ncbi:MAG TPA: type 1 glutamine amidotransferase [Desulfobacteria bacterium]|nr:type 1 glutamine amidotransferase [Desulfobacteria bacterium]
MRIHYLQHVPFEDLANISVWAEEKGHSVSATKLFSNEALPSMEQFEWLIVMGGPMNIYEEEDYKWLAAEKAFIKEAIQAGKIVLGICLGAQLIADVLGGKVTSNEYKEIGWFPVTKLKEAANSLLGPLPEEFMAFHWHGDTFKTPPGAIRLAESKACKNQAFQFGDKVLGLQFHLESSGESIERLAAACGNEITDGEFIQKETGLLTCPDYLKSINSCLIRLLDTMELQFNAG